MSLKSIDHRVRRASQVVVQALESRRLLSSTFSSELIACNDHQDAEVFHASVDQPKHLDSGTGQSGRVEFVGLDENGNETVYDLGEGELRTDTISTGEDELTDAELRALRYFVAIDEDGFEREFDLGEVQYIPDFYPARDILREGQAAKFNIAHHNDSGHGGATGIINTGLPVWLESNGPITEIDRTISDPESASVQTFDAKFGSATPVSVAPDPVRGAPSREIVSMSWEGQERQVVANQWIISFSTPSPTYTLEGELVSTNISAGGPATTAVQISSQVSNLGSGYAFIRYLGTKQFALVEAPLVNVTAAKTALTSLPNVVQVQPNFVSRTLSAVPNDPGYPDQYGLNNSNGADINAPEAWNISKGYSGTVVGVIDSGIDLTHPDLIGNIWTNPGEIAGNGIDDDGNGYVDDTKGWDFVNNDAIADDDNGHGTHVAGTIGAVTNNATGVAGTAWEVSLVPLKAADAGGILYSDTIIGAISYASNLRDAGINIRTVNGSYGGLVYDPGEYAAVSAASDAGILFTFAAGNGGSDKVGDNNDLVPTYPSSFNLPNIIAVASTNSSDQLASSSNFGVSSVDIAAPGVSILSTYPTDISPFNYAYSSGTSMAAPHVAGVVALSFTVAPNALVDEVRTAILDGATTFSGLSTKVATGGRLNAQAALQNLFPAGLVVNGDGDGSPNNDTISVQLGTDTNYIEAYIQGVLVSRVLLSSVSSIAVNGLGGNDVITISSSILLPTRINGGNGSDTITGGAGADTIIGGAGNDNINGGAGTDNLSGGAGNDTIAGGQGNDIIGGGQGVDVLTGGDGNDTITGGAGADRYVFGNTNVGQTEIVVETSAEANALDFSTSTGGVVANLQLDTYIASMASRFIVTGATGQADFFQNVLGSSVGDAITGNDAPNSLLGNGGNDTIYGLAGNDTLGGGAGDDTLGGGTGNDSITGGTGSDSMIGGNNDDTFFANDGILDTIDGGAGNDTAFRDALLDVVSNVEVLA